MAGGLTLAIELPPEIEMRLDKAIQADGRSKSDFVVDALRAHLDDVEDLLAADAAMADICSGRSSTMSLDDVERELGLAD